MIRFIAFCGFILSCCFNLYGNIDCSITLNNLTNKKLTIECHKDMTQYKLINGIYEEQEKQSISHLDFNEKSKYKFVSTKGNESINIKNNDDLLSIITLKSTEKPQIDDKKHKNTVCKLYSDNLGSYIVIISDDEEKIDKEISSLEDPGMPQQWFLQH